MKKYPLWAKFVRKLPRFIRCPWFSDKYFYTYLKTNNRDDLDLYLYLSD